MPPNHQPQLGGTIQPAPVKAMFATDEQLERELQLVENGCLHIEQAAQAMGRAVRKVREQLKPSTASEQA